MALIKLEGVSKYYKTPEGVSSGMQGVNLEFDINEFVAITGESGSGKSTLLNVLSGLDGYEEGEMYVLKEETSHFLVSDWEDYRSKYIGFIFQNYNIIDSYTVFQNVMLALEIQNYPLKKRKERAFELIEKVGLSSHKHQKASKLSGGQKQRTVIARALAKDCPVIVADEPTGNLDSQSSEKIIKLLHEISKDKLVIIVTHNYQEVAPYVTRKIKMHDGEVTEDLPIKPFEKGAYPDANYQVKVGFLTILKFAFRNTFATPKRFVFFLLLHLLVAFAFMTTYANTVSRAAKGLDLATGGMRHSFLVEFDYGTDYLPENRLLLARKDGKPFDEADMLTLQTLKGNPYISLNNHFLDRRLGGISSSNKEALLSDLKLDVDYFLPQQLKNLNQQAIISDLKVYPLIASHSTGLMLNDMVHISKRVLELKEDSFEYRYIEYQFKVIGITSDTTEHKLFLSEATLSDIDASTYGLFSTISFKTFGEAATYRKAIDTETYRLFFPSDQASNASIFRMLQFIINVFFYIVTFAVGIFLYLVLHAVTKNLMISRKKDFAIYRSIGANKRMLGYLVIIEQVILYLFAITILFILMLLLNQHVTAFRSMIAFLRPQDYVLVIMILLLFTIWLGLRFNKKVFKFSVIEALSESKEDLL